MNTPDLTRRDFMKTSAFATFGGPLLADGREELVESPDPIEEPSILETHILRIHEIEIKIHKCYTPDESDQFTSSIKNSVIAELIHFRDIKAGQHFVLPTLNIFNGLGDPRDQCEIFKVTKISSWRFDPDLNADLFRFGDRTDWKRRYLYYNCRTMTVVIAAEPSNATLPESFELLYNHYTFEMISAFKGHQS